MLAARPVVPLEEVRASGARTGLARPWVLGLGLAGALLIGVLATVMYYSQSTGDDSRLFQGVEVASGAEGISAEGISEEPNNSFSGPASPQPNIEPEKRVAISNPPAADNEAAKANAEPKKKPRLVAVINDRKVNNQVEEDPKDATDDRRTARREARRERRRAVRERRGGKSDDLMRIRDIFEGSPRP